jgi:hypothetical protein
LTASLISATFESSVEADLRDLEQHAAFAVGEGEGCALPIVLKTSDDGNGLPPHWADPDGAKVRLDQPLDGILNSFPVQWHLADDSWYGDLFGYGLWFYQEAFSKLDSVISI